MLPLVKEFMLMFTIVLLHVMNDSVMMVVEFMFMLHL